MAYLCQISFFGGNRAFISNDDSLTRRVPNWYQYFADKGLLYSGDKSYQVGDVIFLKDEQGIPNHSAIVTRIRVILKKMYQNQG